MMKNLTTDRLFAVIAASTLFFVAILMDARPATSKNDQRAVIERENEWLSHLTDGPTLEKILADDFRHPVPAGLFLTKQQHIAWAVKHPRAASWRAEFERLEIRIYGATAVATGIVSATERPGAKPQRTIFTDVFVFQNGQWKAVNAQENQLVDGR